ncbi:MAG TPA: hypothetical protein EYH31_05410 [Anaerolineae bacterium]|nr:hypothetical protein [Anaerolineae bacterium]
MEGILNDLIGVGDAPVGDAIREQDDPVVANWIQILRHLLVSQHQAGVQVGVAGGPDGVNAND